MRWCWRLWLWDTIEFLLIEISTRRLRRRWSYLGIVLLHRYSWWRNFILLRGGLCHETMGVILERLHRIDRGCSCLWVTNYLVSVWIIILLLWWLRCGRSHWDKMLGRRLDMLSRLIWIATANISNIFLRRERSLRLDILLKLMIFSSQICDLLFKQPFLTKNKW